MKVVVVPLTLKNRRFSDLMITPIKYIKAFSKTKKCNLFSIAVADSDWLLVSLELFFNKLNMFDKEKKNVKVRR